MTPSPTNVSKAFLILLIVTGLLTIGMVAPYLLAVFLGWILATVLRPLYQFLIARKWKPTRAALVGALIATFTIILPIAGFGFATVKNLIRVVSPYAKGGLDGEVWAGRILRIPIVRSIFESPEEFKVFFDENSRKAIEMITGGLSGVIGAAPELALQLVLALLGCFFFLRDGAAFCAWMSPRVPLPPETKSDLARTLGATGYSSFLSMLFASLAQSIVVFIGFIVLKVPMAMLAFGIAFVAAWFPIFGVTPVWIAAMIYLFASDRTGAAIGMIGFGLVASVADNVVRPWVMNDREDIHPFVSLVAIFGAIRFFGIIGVLVGPVMVACLIELLKLWPDFAAELGLLTEKSKRDPAKARAK